MIYVLIALLVLLALFLLLPLGVELDYSERGRKWFVVWLGLRVPVPGIARRVDDLFKHHKADDGGEDTGEQESEKWRARHEFSKAGELVRTMTSNVQKFQSGLDTVRSISRHIHVKVHRLDMVVATPNPALTGFAYGMTQALGYAIGANVPWHAEPDFEQAEPALSMRVEVSVTPIMMIQPALRFARSAAKRRMARRGPRADKKSKE
jgi:hypothetical protein